MVFEVVTVHFISNKNFLRFEDLRQHFYIFVFFKMQLGKIVVFENFYVLYFYLWLKEQSRNNR